MQLTAHYYRRHDANPEAEVPAEGYLGWASMRVEVPVEESALICMHFWNLGLDKRLPYGTDVPYAGWYRVGEYISRTLPIVRKVMPPLLAAAREGGLAVMHVGIGPFAQHYLGFALAREIAGPDPEAPAGAPDNPQREQWHRDWMAAHCGEHNLVDLQDRSLPADFPEEVRPRDDEPVVVTTHQLNAVCRQRGIWHLLYCGFCVNACLQTSRCGLGDMRRLGYACSIVRDATTGGENKETARAEWAKEIGIGTFDCAFDSADLIDALRG